MNLLYSIYLYYPSNCLAIGIPGANLVIDQVAGGVRLHPDTLRAFGTDRAPARWPWILAGAAGAAFLYLLFH